MVRCSVVNTCKMCDDCECVSGAAGSFSQQQLPAPELGSDTGQQQESNALVNTAINNIIP